MILSLEKKYNKKKEKIEDDENSAEAVRNRSMERLSETEKR